MDKLTLLTIVVVCLALAAEARPNKRDKSNRQEKVVKPEPKPKVRKQELTRRTDAKQLAQRVVGGGNQAGGSAGAVSQSSLQAGERDLDAIQALLQAKQARQERLDAKAERKARRKEAARLAEGDRLTAQNAVDYETYLNEAEFNNLDAAASVDIENQFGLSVQSANSLKEDAAISASNGISNNFGTRFSIDEAIDAASYVDEEAVYEDEYADDQLLSAGLEIEDALNAQEGARVESEVFIDAQQRQEIGAGFRRDDFFNQVRANNPFNFFKK